MIFYDYECFKCDWLVVLIDPVHRKETVIINDPERLKVFHEENKTDIWVGFNNRHYDQYIHKAILLGIDPWKVNEWIIVKGNDGWKYSSMFNEIKMINYDVMQRTDRGLKWFEGSMGSMIKESSVDFTLDRKLTEAELQETVMYCRHDVEETIKLFIERKDDFNAQIELIKMFPEALSIWDLSKTKAQMSAKILGCTKTKRTDEFDLFVLPCIRIQKYKAAVDWFLNPANHRYDSELLLTVAGVEHKIAWGGVHAGKKQFHGGKDNRQYWHVDVASFYPRLMIFHNLLTRNTSEPEKFKQIYERRIELKKAGKKKEQAPLKIVINGTYGISKDKTSAAYDPRNANLVCMNGQLMLIDLIEHLEKIDGFQLVQSNTDGLIVSLPNTDQAFEQMDDICYEWEQRCNMELEFDEISEIWQKDVNNYVFRFSSGELEKKGDYVKSLSNIDYGSFPIVNKALIDYMVSGVPVERTINECSALKDFQMICKISSKYKCLTHGNEVLNEKCVRAFASRNSTDAGLFKVSERTGKPEKFASSPEHCFLYNDDVNDVSVPKQLDRDWYINLAIKRLIDFGVMT